MRSPRFRSCLWTSQASLPATWCPALELGTCSEGAKTPEAKVWSADSLDHADFLTRLRQLLVHPRMRSAEVSRNFRCSVPLHM